MFKLLIITTAFYSASISTSATIASFDTELEARAAQNVLSDDTAAAGSGSRVAFNTRVTVIPLF